MPEIKPVGKGFSFIGAGKVDDRRRAAANGAFAAAFKIIGRCGVAHVKIKVRVRVDKAGKEHAARHIDDLALRGEIGRDMADLFNFFTVDEHIGTAAAAAADNKTASKHCFHGRDLLMEKILFQDKVSIAYSRLHFHRKNKKCEMQQDFCWNFR